MIVSARDVAEGCSQKKKDPLTGPVLSSDARAGDRRLIAALRASGARLRGPPEQARHALAETPQRPVEPHVLGSILLTARVATRRPRRQRPRWSVVAGARADKPPRMTFS
jgi:hypothetical protein